MKKLDDNLVNAFIRMFCFVGASPDEVVNADCGLSVVEYVTHFMGKCDDITKLELAEACEQVAKKQIDNDDVVELLEEFAADIRPNSEA